LLKVGSEVDPLNLVILDIIRIAGNALPAIGEDRQEGRIIIAKLGGPASALSFQEGAVTGVEAMRRHHLSPYTLLPPLGSVL
jgi:hypothetical protein